MIRVTMPHHLRTLAKVDGELALDVAAPVTVNAILDALEAEYPMLCGTIRDHQSHDRRPKVRFYANCEDITHDPPDNELPAVIASGEQPFMIVGAISGG